MLLQVLAPLLQLATTSKVTSKGFNPSETDTEIIPHLIGLEIEHSLANGLPPNEQTLLFAVQKVLTLLEGTYSIAVIWSKAPNALVVARGQAPLVLGFGEGEFFCASDTPALYPSLQGAHLSTCAQIEMLH